MKRVVVAFVVREGSDGPEVLLVASKKDFGQHTGFYYPPGGHVEDGEEDIHALRREILEELGVEANVEELLAETPGDVPEQHTLWYRCSLNHHDFLVDDELANAQFFSQDALQKLPLWPATETFLKKYFLS